MGNKTAIIVGAGLGGIATALRLNKLGYTVKIVEKNSTAGGRLNILKTEGFTFDIGPSFFSMSYEFEELFNSIEEPIPFTIEPLSPLYSVWFKDNKTPYLIHKELEKLALEFAKIEPNFKEKAEKYLLTAKNIFHDTENLIVKNNFNSLADYFLQMAKVPKKHLPYLFRSFWKHLENHFESEEVKIIFSLVAFFLGATPFNTPSIYSLLNYTELQHNGYWNVRGGMYKIVEGMLQLLKKNNIEICYNTDIQKVIYTDEKVVKIIDQNDKEYHADLFIINADAASFRGKFLNRKKFTEKKLDSMHWTLAPFTMYIGVQGKIPNIEHHNYFLGNNFKQYADDIFRSDIAPQKPYYYVNVASKSNPNCAPENCENLFILCPVPDLRIKPNWDDSEDLQKSILTDLSERINFDIEKNMITKTVYTPKDWQNMFHLYKGSGLGLAHGMNQIGYFRPKNKDEQLNNLYYVGASTHPGTGLPIVIIGSKLVSERIKNEHRIVS